LCCRRRRRLALHARKLGGLGTREAVERMSDRHEPHGGTAVRLVACQPLQRSGSARPLSHANSGGIISSLRFRMIAAFCVSVWCETAA
jgi:hypothetical protein